MADLLGVLKAKLGFSAFRPFQREVVEAALSGRDSLVVMATGSGKSLCYQLPPLVANKTAVVISPLISLMQDQVLALKQRGVKAEYLGSAQANEAQVKAGMLQGEYSVVYLTPEKACALPPVFWQPMLQRKQLCLLAVDEAHCVSEWGHEFRPGYQQLGPLRATHFPNVPCLAFTATATERVRSDLAAALKLANPLTIVATFHRPNLHYSVRSVSEFDSTEDLMMEVAQEVQMRGGSSIVYCPTKKAVAKVAEDLRMLGIECGIYHSEVPASERTRVHRAFAMDELQVVVATVAFGMGIDKPDVRTVIHIGSPKSLEAYYQESGRAGRDGLPAHCILFHYRADSSRNSFYLSAAHTEERREAVQLGLQAMRDYCTTEECRCWQLLQHFGEALPMQSELAEHALTQDSAFCGNCDNCDAQSGIAYAGARRRVQTEVDVGKEAVLLLMAVRDCGGRWGMNMPIDVLRGSRARKLLERSLNSSQVYGAGCHRSANYWKELGDKLLGRQLLKESSGEAFRLIDVSQKGDSFLESAIGKDISLRLRCAAESVLAEPLQQQQNGLHARLPLGLEAGTAPIAAGGGTMSEMLHRNGFSEAEVRVYEGLRHTRGVIARHVGVPPYAVASEQVLHALARQRPSSLARLSLVEGVNEWLAQQHGLKLHTAVRHLSHKEGLTLDNPASAEASSSSPGSPKRGRAVGQDAVALKKLTDAQEHAWRKWMEEGMTWRHIATLPERTRALQVPTVAEYCLDAAQAGYPFDWARFALESGFNATMALTAEAAVKDALAKAGNKAAKKGARAPQRARDLQMKAIKEAGPERLSYLHIKTWLALDDLGLSWRQVLTCATGPQEQSTEVGEHGASMRRSAAEDAGPAEQERETPRAGPTQAQASVVLGRHCGGRDRPEPGAGSRGQQESALRSAVGKRKVPAPSQQQPDATKPRMSNDAGRPAHGRQGDVEDTS